MKKTAQAELCGQVIQTRILSPLGLLSLYEVAFTTGKYAVIRLDHDPDFQNGDIFKRTNNHWYCEGNLIHPLSFQFVDKAEAERSFIEFEQ